MMWWRLLTRPGRSWPFAAAGLAVVGWYMGGGGAVWRGDTPLTLDNITGSVMFLSATTAADAAYEVARHRLFHDQFCSRSRRQLLFALTTTILPPVVLSLAVLTLALLGCLGVTAALGGSLSAPLTWWLEPLLVLPPLLGASALGAAVGRLPMPPPLAAGASATATFGIAVAEGMYSLPPLFAPAGATGSVTGLTVDWAVARSATLGAVLLVLVCSIAATKSITVDFRTATLQASAVMLALGSFLTSWHASGVDFWALSNSPVSLTCSGSVAQTCLATNNARFLDLWSKGIDNSVAELRSMGIDPRDRYEQDVSFGTAETRVGGISRVDLNTIPPSPRDIATTLARQSGCQVDKSLAERDQETLELRAARLRAFVREWLLATLKWESGRPEVDPRVSDWIRDTPQEDQRERVRASFDALKRCDFEAMSIPKGYE